MEINMQGGVQLPMTLPGARSADLPVAKPTETDAGSARVPGSEKTDTTTPDQRRAEAVYRAAESFFKDVYAVSDTRFSIFKDSSGQYITRYTSLRDGRVTYIPEPDMLAYLERKMQNREALLAITV